MSHTKERQCKIKRANASAIAMCKRKREEEISDAWLKKIFRVRKSNFLHRSWRVGQVKDAGAKI